MKHHLNQLSISILIPRYNFDTNTLVEDLLTQADALQLEYEIRMVDDASTTTLINNKTISNHPNFIFQQLQNNIGRAAIRNYLASQAKYNYLLFIDCDSKITPLFLEKYTTAATPKTVVAGGTIYEQNPPIDSKFHLHWQYGRKIETKALNKTDLFHSNNFLIHRSIFQKVRFDEKVAGYGHEDTFFRIALQQLNIPILKIPNPVCHIGLNTTPNFLKNTRNAIDNLLKHTKYNPKHPIIRLNNFARATHINNTIRILFNKTATSIEKKLNKRNPSIALFTTYKLLYILSR